MKKLLTVFIILIFSVTVFAGDAARKGTAGAEQLLIPVGARSIATVGAFNSHFTGVESIYYNPGGLDRMKGTEAMFNMMQYIADINISYFAIATKLGIGSIGLTYKGIDFGDIPVTTNQNPDGTGQTFSPNYFVLGFTYSTMITDRVSAGASLSLINETIMNTGASGFAIDFGVQYRFAPNFSLGVSVKNIGGNMRYTGEDLKVKTEVPSSALGSGLGVYEVDTESFQIPSYFDLSMGYTFEFTEENRLSIAGVFRNNNTIENELKLGLEFQFLNVLSLRGGYNFLTENSSTAIYNWAVGAGINFNIADSFDLMFDYAYRNVEDFPADNHVFTLILGFH
ncbi:MAG: PorV/PorQ family protein [Chlorobi bacterium]|nr:PorV/PorQ family protein [Chlorobiota bacterium]